VSAAVNQHRAFGVQFANSLYTVDSWAIMKAAPNLKTAQQFLYFTGAPIIEARLLKGNGEAGLAKGLEDGLPPEVVATSPTAPANLTVGLKVDAQFWHDNLGKLKTRFDAWLSH
jgi:putative spermidine/putrescine transport system substrate-binding protein